MFFLATAFVHLFAAVPGPAPVGAPPEPKVTVRSGVVFDGRLICLYSDGTVGAWDLKTEKYAKDAAARFTRKGLLHLAADDKKLWAADEKTVYLWSAKKREWEKSGGFDAGNETLLALTPARGRPLLVFHSKVIDPTREKDGTSKFPKDLGALPGSRLSISATHGTDKMLWLGTDYGEWGGTLIGFDPETGKWIKSSTSRGVTGITEGGGDEVIVSKFMSHGGIRGTAIEVFKPDATEKVSHPILDDRCYYGLAYNRHDKTLYGMEWQDLVTIKQELVTINDGKPTKVAEAEFGVLALIPLGPKSLAVIADQGAPYLLRDGKLVRLPAPAAADLPVAPAPRPKAEARMPGYRSGKHANIVVIINPTPQPGDKDRVNPLGRLEVDAQGRLFLGNIFCEVTDENLKHFIASEYKKSDEAELVVEMKDPAETSFTTLAAVVDRISVAVAEGGKKRVLTLLFYTRGK